MRVVPLLHSQRWLAVICTEEAGEHDEEESFTHALILDDVGMPSQILIGGKLSMKITGSAHRENDNWWTNTREAHRKLMAKIKEAEDRHSEEVASRGPVNPVSLYKSNDLDLQAHR